MSDFKRTSVGQTVNLCQNESVVSLTLLHTQYTEYNGIWQYLANQVNRRACLELQPSSVHIPLHLASTGVFMADWLHAAMSLFIISCQITSLR